MSTSPRPDRGESTPDAFRHHRVPLSLSVGGAWSLWQGDERGAVRVPIRFGVTIPRWRVHVRNYTTRTGRPGSSSVVVPGIWIGRRTGSRVDETVRISPELTSRGDDMVTPWQETPLGARRDYMLVIRYFSDGPSLQQVGGCWTVPFEDAVSAADGRHSSRMPLDVWIEAEVPQEVPVRGVRRLLVQRYHRDPPSARFVALAVVPCARCASGPLRGFRIHDEHLA